MRFRLGAYARLQLENLRLRHRLVVLQRQQNRRLRLTALDRAFWVPFVDTYRTMCRAPEAEFKRVLEDVRDMRLTA